MSTNTTEFRVEAPCGTSKDGFESRTEAEEGADTHEALCPECSNGDCSIEPVGATPDGGNVPGEPSQRSGQEAQPEVIEHDGSEPQPTEPKQSPELDKDPVDWVPSHFVDKIQGVPTINRKGYCVLAERYGVSVESQPVTLPSETDFEYAEFKAVATTENGQTYTGFGSAHIAREDGDDPYLLGELAETRAMKRATAWATGVGMTAIEELESEL